MTGEFQRVYRDKRLLMQWHITDRCNLRCSHCYQENYSGKELGFDELLGILEQYKELLAHWDTRNILKGHITVTGGEPFIRKDFLDLLEAFSDFRQLFSFAILTNGTFIDKDMAIRLKSLQPRFVQVSMEGARATHDSIRGKGNYDRTVAALKYLAKEEVPSSISFTAHLDNYREFREVAKLGGRLGVSNVWADRLIPCGSGSSLGDLILTPEATKELFDIMLKARKEALRNPFNRTTISMHRALQFLVGGGVPYSCAAGDTLITVMPNGDLYPCRRMPVRVGNVLETSLGELYFENKFLLTLRDRERMSEGCKECLYSKVCRGGLKCLSHAVKGDPFKADPGCWLAVAGRDFASLFDLSSELDSSSIELEGE